MYWFRTVEGLDEDPAFNLIQQNLFKTSVVIYETELHSLDGEPVSIMGLPGSTIFLMGISLRDMLHTL